MYKIGIIDTMNLKGLNLLNDYKIPHTHLGLWAQGISKIQKSSHHKIQI